MDPALLPAEPPQVFRLDELRLGGVGLRALTADDWPLEQELSRCADVVRWTTIPPDLSEEQARKRIDRGLAAGAQSRLARYVIVCGGSSAGTCGIGAVDDSVEVFYAVLPEARGHGLATLAASTLARWVRDVGSTVTLLTFPDNLASQRVARRAGFEPAGELLRTIKGVETTLLRWQLD